MALRKLMNISEIRKHRKNLMRGLSALATELEMLANEVNPDEEFNTDEALWIEEYLYAGGGVDDLISDMMMMLINNRDSVKRIRRGGGGGTL